MDFHSLARKDLQFLSKKNHIPANLTNIAMAKALEALEIVEGIEEIQETLKITTMASKEEEIQEILGFQSLNIKSPENPRTCRRNSALKPSAPHRSRKAASKDSDVIDMNYKEEGEKKDVQNIFPKTPATRKLMKGVEGQSSRRRYKKNEEVENHNETPKAVVGKGIGVVTRRSARLSSRKVIEDSVTSQSNCRRNSREHSAVMMKVLGKKDRPDQEKKDVDEYGDSYAVVVEESGKEDQEVEIHEISSDDDDDVDDSNNEVENESEAANENMPMIQQQQPSPRRRCTRATAKVLEASKIVSKEKEDGRKAAKFLPNTYRRNRLSSRISVEEKSREEEAVKMEDLTEENAEEQVKKDENKDHAEKSDSCIVDPVEKDEEKGKQEEIHGYSIVAVVEVVDEKDQEVESHGFSSSTQEDCREEGAVKMVDLTEENAEGQEKEEENKDQAEKSDSCIVNPVEEDEEKDKKEEIHGCYIVALIEEAKENVQEVESHDFSSSTQEDNSNYLVENGDSTVALAEEDQNNCIVAPVEEDEEKDKKEEIYGCSSSTQENSSNYSVENGDSTVILAEEDQNNDKELEIQVLSSSIERDNANVEPKNDVITKSHKLSSFCGENSMVEVHATFKSTEESSNQPPVNDYVKDCKKNSPENEHVEDCSDHSSENGLVDDFNNQGNEEPSSETKLAISAVSDNLHCSETSPLPHEESSVILEEEENLSVLFTKMTLNEAEESSNTLLDPVAAHEVVSKAMRETRQVEECLSSLASKIPAATEELTINDSVFVQGTSFEPQIMVSELCSEFSMVDSSIKSVEDKLHKLAVNKKTEIFQGPSFELCSEVSIADSAIELKEASCYQSSEISDVIGESVEAGFPNLDEHSNEKSVDMEISQDASLEKEVFLKEGNLELLSLTKLKTILKQKLNGMKAEQERKKSTIKQEELESMSRSSIKQEQNLNVDMMKEREKSTIKPKELECMSRSSIKQEQKLNVDMMKEDSGCLSRSSKLDSNCKRKINDDMIKSERKRTPLKSLNYSTF